MGILWGLDWKWVPSEPFFCCFCWVTQDYFRPVTVFHINSYVGHFGSIQGKRNSNSKRSCDAGLRLHILSVRFWPPTQSLNQGYHTLHWLPVLRGTLLPDPPVLEAVPLWRVVAGGRGFLTLLRALSYASSYMEDVWVQGLFFWFFFVGEHLGPWITETKGSSQGNGGISSTFSLLVVSFLFASSLWGLPFLHASSAMYLKGFWLHCTLSVFMAIAGALSGYRICLSTKTGSPLFRLFTLQNVGFCIMCTIFHF